MRVLIAGCAGFIGYHFSRRMLDDGHQVVGLDNVSTGHRDNVRDLASHAAFRFTEHDITKRVTVEGPFDWVCNLACPASPIDFGPRRLEILAVSSQGAWNLLDFAREKNARFLHSSTSEVYGDPLEHPQRETYWGNVNPIGPRSCYDEGKRFAEALVTAYHRQHGTPVRMARIFNTYGPRMRGDDGRVLPNFINQALRGEALTVYGDGRQTRSFCYVSDLVDGLVRLAGSELTEPVNLGNPVEITMLELASEVIRLIGSRSPITHVELPGDDPKVRCPDITRARTKLAWEPKIKREDGLARTIDWFREHPVAR